MKDLQPGWYLVYTKPRQEDIAKSHLQSQGFSVYLPMLKHYKQNRFSQSVIEPLFPRYLFVQLDIGLQDWSKIRSTRGCVSLVRFGLLPAKVPITFIDHLQGTEDSRVEQVKQKSSHFKPGDRVEIIASVFEGYQGIVVAQNSHERITLLLDFVKDYSRQVHLPAHQIRLISDY